MRDFDAGFNSIPILFPFHTYQRQSVSQTAHGFAANLRTKNSQWEALFNMSGLEIS